ncbi:uncharacterized protein LOC111611355 [Xiphophorus maculatus]|uniref:uncharacterized protein LOC111611355 n=1 Tax=Xiphophorus maculatus TaxID=8083 RepID=UPI000C6D0EEE|nr:uncharacterized protein LOC111611355 [Xiphophorus maculatus]
MAETSLGAFRVVKTLLGGTAAGFVFGQAASYAVKPSLTEDVTLLNAATRAAGRAGSTGVAVVAACLMFTSALLSLGLGFLLSAMVLKLLNKVGVTLPWLIGAMSGASVALGAVITGGLEGIIPPWIYIMVQGTLVLIVYSYSNINDMTTALLIIFTTLYASVIFGRLGAILGFFCMGLSIIVLFALRRTLTARSPPKPESKTRCKLLERIFFYSVFVAILGFFVGLGSGGAEEGTKTQVILMLQSVLWVGFLSVGLLGAGLGTVAMVGLGPEVAGKVGVGAVVVTSIALKAVVLLSSALGLRSCSGAALGATTAAGVSLGAASVAAKQTFGSRNSTLVLLGSVILGVLVALKVPGLTSTQLTTSELITVTFTAVGAFILGAPKSPFHTKVNLQQGLLTGTELIKGIGMETVTAAAAPIGAGALGAAALGTAALGTLGTVGVLVAIVLALGSALSGMLGKSPSTTNTHRD